MMQPFSLEALIAMLRAFYPMATPADLARARRERPEYFGAGRLIGASGTLLLLPDGRLYEILL